MRLSMIRGAALRQEHSSAAPCQQHHLPGTRPAQTQVRGDSPGMLPVPGVGDVRRGRAGWRRMGMRVPSLHWVLGLMCALLSSPWQHLEGSAAGSPSMPS